MLTEKHRCNENGGRNGSSICLCYSVVYMDADLSVGIHVKERGLAMAISNEITKHRGRTRLSIRVGQRAIEVYI